MGQVFGVFRRDAKLPMKPAYETESFDGFFKTLDDPNTTDTSAEKKESKQQVGAQHSTTKTTQKDDDFIFGEAHQTHRL